MPSTTDVPNRRAFIRDLTGAGLVVAGAPFGVARPRLAKASAPQGPLDGLDRYIEQALTDWKIPGAAVAVVHGDRIIYAKGHGVKEIGDPDKVDENTLFQIGSTTKAFTTGALGILVEEKRLRWDDPVITYLPDFQLHDPWITRMLTIRDTVTHRSGFLDYSGPALEIIDAAEALRRMRYRSLPGAFRDSYNYSNLMFGVAGTVIERASGMTWGAFVKARLFEPLAMRRSGTSPYDFWDTKYVSPTFLGTAPAGAVGRQDSRDPNVAMPHTLQDGPARVIPWQSYDNLAAAGSIVSSVADLSNWLILHLNGGGFQGRQVLKADTISDLHSPQNLRDPSRYPFDEGSGSYASGWRRQTYRGETNLSHGGGILGFPAHVFIMPHRKVGVVVLANGRTPTTDDYEIPNFDHYLFHKTIALWIFDRLMAAPPTDWRRHYLKQLSDHEKRLQEREASLRASRLQDAGPTLDLTRYTGEYEDRSRLLGRMRISVENRRLVLRFPGDGAYSAYLDHWHRDVFRLESLGVRFRRGFVDFAIGPNGEVASLNALGGDYRHIA